MPGRKIGTHTLRHSYAHHLLMNGIQINHLSRWLGTLLDPDYLNLPGAGTGPVGQSRPGAMNRVGLLQGGLPQGFQHVDLWRNSRRHSSTTMWWHAFVSPN